MLTVLTLAPARTCAKLCRRRGADIETRKREKVSSMFSTAVQLCGSIAFDVTGNCTRFAQQQSANATAATTAVSKLTKRPLIASRTLTEALAKWHCRCQTADWRREKEDDHVPGRANSWLAAHFIVHQFLGLFKDYQRAPFEQKLHILAIALLSFLFFQLSMTSFLGKNVTCLAKFMSVCVCLQCPFLLQPFN